MRRALIAAVLGGLAMFLLDPDVGTRRRRDLAHVFGEGRETLEQAGKSSRRAARDAKKASRRAAATIGQLRRDASGRSSGPSATAWLLVIVGIVGAAAAGVALTYVFDPDRGAQRRERLRQAADEARSQVRQQGAQSIDQVKGRISELREEAEPGLTRGPG